LHLGRGDLHVLADDQQFDGEAGEGHASANMQQFGHGIEDDSSYVAFNVANVGKADTTITHVAVYAFKGARSWLRNRPTKVWLVNHAIAAYEIPYVLKPGQTFMSMGKQTRDIERWSREARLYGVILHSFGSRPLFLRIKPINPPSVGASPAKLS
jgi:hypothetical protein